LADVYLNNSGQNCHEPLENERTKELQRRIEFWLK